MANNGYDNLCKENRNSYMYWVSEKSKQLFYKYIFSKIAEPNSFNISTESPY